MATTRADLRTRVRELADEESTNRVTDPILNAWINTAYRRLYNRVVAAFQDHFWTSVDFTLAGGTETASKYTASSAIKHVRILEKSPDTPHRIVVTRWELGEKDMLNKLAYRYVGSVIWVEPYERSGGNYRLHYIPGPSLFAADGDALDGRLDDWEDAIVYECAIKCRIRDEADTADLRASLAQLEAEIDQAAMARDAAHPPRCNEVTPVWDVGTGGGGAFVPGGGFIPGNTQS